MKPNNYIGRKELIVLTISSCSQYFCQNNLGQYAVHKGLQENIIFLMEQFCAFRRQINSRKRSTIATNEKTL